MKGRSESRLFLRPRLKALLWILSIFIVGVLSTGLDLFLMVPHELGHYLACLLCGAQVQEIKWLGIEGAYVEYLLPYDSPGKRVIAFSGGLFAGFVVFLAYMIFSRVYKLNADLESKSDTVMLAVRIVLMIGLMKQLMYGVLEGIVPDIYMLTFEPLPYFAIAMFLAALSIKIHKIIIRRNVGYFQIRERTNTQQIC